MELNIPTLSTGSFKLMLKAGMVSTPEKALSKVQGPRDTCFNLHLSDEQFRVSVSKPHRNPWQIWVPVACSETHNNTSYTGFVYLSLSLYLLFYSSHSHKRSSYWRLECLHWAQRDNLRTIFTSQGLQR